MLYNFRSSLVCCQRSICLVLRKEKKGNWMNSLLNHKGEQYTSFFLLQIMLELMELKFMDRILIKDRSLIII